MLTSKPGVWPSIDEAERDHRADLRRSLGLPELERQVALIQSQGLHGPVREQIERELSSVRASAGGAPDTAVRSKMRLDEIEGELKKSEPERKKRARDFERRL